MYEEKKKNKRRIFLFVGMAMYLPLLLFDFRFLCCPATALHSRLPPTSLESHLHLSHKYTYNIKKIKERRVHIPFTLFFILLLLWFFIIIYLHNYLWILDIYVYYYILSTWIFLQTPFIYKKKNCFFLWYFKSGLQRFGDC